MRQPPSYTGSPDPDGRQIDGLGGGISSLSKVAVIGRPREPCQSLTLRKSRDGDASEFAWPDGVSWADDVERAIDSKNGWDVVYRFAQIGVRDPVVDWGSTCGNLVAAVAHVSARFPLPISFIIIDALFIVCSGRRDGA